MGWQVLSPFRGYANHQFTGGYDYGLFATAAASPEEMRQSAFLAYAIQEREDHGQIAAVADIFDERGAAAADDE